jgi:predicted permease
MSQLLFRAVLTLLPQPRRARYGREMADVFRALVAETRSRAGALGVGLLLMSELRGVVRFALRERLQRLGDWRSAGGGCHPLRELRWADRNVRARGWRAALAVGLLAVAIAMTSVAFSATDALLLTRVPYPNADRLLALGMLRTGVVADLRQHTDLFEYVHGYLTRPIFLTGQDQPEIVDVADVTAGLLDALGVRAAAGRLLVEADAADEGTSIAVISDRLARARFGTATQAVGQRIDTTAAPLVVVGVMPPEFRFPSGGFDVWRAIDLRHPRLRSMSAVALIRSERAPADTAALVARRVGDAEARAGLPSRSIAPRPLLSRTMEERPRRLLLIVAAAAICLLLTACLNVASLELAAAFARRPLNGVQMALGASRAALVRTALAEGALITGAAAVLALPLAAWATAWLSTGLPDRIFDSVNPIDLDLRTLAFLVATSVIVWIGIAVPPALVAMGARPAHLLQSGVRTTAKSSARIRRWLTATQVAFAVLLLSGTVLYARSYRAMLAVDKGFDSSSLYALMLTMPTQVYPSAWSRDALARDIRARLERRPDVVDVTMSAPLPPSLGERYRAERPEIDGRPIAAGERSFGIRRVDVHFFRALRLPLREGRAFEPAGAPDDAVIDESMARAFWPDGSASRHTFRIADGMPAMRVVGIAAHVFNAADDVAAESDSFFQVYVLQQPPAPTVEQPARAINDLPLYGSIEFGIRMRPGAPTDEIGREIRALDPRIRVRLRAIDDIYAERFDDTRLATLLVAAFATVAFALTVAGIYGLMAFLVAARRREIGIRIALGAGRQAVAGMVIGSTLRLVLAGAAAGTIAAAVIARWMSAQFFGVTAGNPWTYAMAAGVVGATAILASWPPARTAARIDPALSLRQE